MFWKNYLISNNYCSKCYTLKLHVSVKNIIGINCNRLQKNFSLLYIYNVPHLQILHLDQWWRVVVARTHRTSPLSRLQHLQQIYPVDRYTHHCKRSNSDWRPNCGKFPRMTDYTLNIECISVAYDGCYATYDIVTEIKAVLFLVTFGHFLFTINIVSEKCTR